MGGWKINFLGGGPAYIQGRTVRLQGQLSQDLKRHDLMLNRVWRCGFTIFGPLDTRVPTTCWATQRVGMDPEAFSDLDDLVEIIEKIDIYIYDIDIDIDIDMIWYDMM